jgi:hypothetical protein
MSIWSKTSAMATTGISILNTLMPPAFPAAAAFQRVPAISIRMCRGPRRLQRQFQFGRDPAPIHGTPKDHCSNGLLDSVHAFPSPLISALASGLLAWAGFALARGAKPQFSRRWACLAGFGLLLFAFLNCTPPLART